MRRFWNIGWIAGCILLMAGALSGCKGSTAQKEPAVEEILKAVQEAYGEDYLPDTDLDEEALSQFMGIDMTLIDTFAAQMPMISAHPDRVVIAKAAEGKGDALEEEFQRIRTTIVEDQMIYPMNIAKTQASQVSLRWSAKVITWPFFWWEPWICGRMPQRKSSFPLHRMK